MGSSGKGGGQGGTLHYNATIACLVAKGPLYSLSKIILNGEVVWEGPIYRSMTTNPVNITTKYGTGHWYWGTEDQAVDPILDGFEDQADLAGNAYFVFVDFDHGQSPNAYNAEFIFRAKPEQSVITGDPAECDANFTVNPIALAAEILTSPAWLGLDPSRLVQESFQAVADDVQSEIVAAGRSASAMSPLYDDQREVRAILQECAGLADAWLRVRPDGKIECGRWRRDSAPASVTTLTFDDLSDFPQVTTDDASQVPNSYAVEFRDSEALHKDAKIAVDDLAGLADAGLLRRKTIQAPFLITHDQALRTGEEALRRTAASSLWHGQVRYAKAVTPAGAQLQPGDYVRAPLSAPGDELVTGLIRIEKVKIPRNATDPVEIEGHVDAGAAPVLAAAAAPVPAMGGGGVLPPINRFRPFGLPAAAVGSAPGVHLLCCKPQDDALGFDVHYDDDPDGDFPIIGRQTSFALPATLDAAIAAGAETVRLSLLPAGANGERYDRDSGFLRNWTGGLTQGRNDELLILLFALNVDGSIASQETLSVAGAPTLVDADTWDVPVLRGRLGTSALAFAGGAWTACEAWVAPRYSLVGFQHADFDCSGSALYFRPGAYSLRRAYAPDTAYEERQRRVTAEEDLIEYAAQPDGDTWVPAYSLIIPASFCPPNPPDDPVHYDDIFQITAGPLSGALEINAKGGNPAVKGWSEFTDPSTPPKKYLLATADQATAWDRFTDACVTPDAIPNGNTSTTGALTYDPVTDAISGAVTHHSSLSGTTYIYDVTAAAPSCGVGVTNTKTTNTLYVDGSPCCGPEAGVTYKHTVASGGWTLSNEDTEENAIIRWDAATEWGGWSSSQPWPIARYQARTAFNWAYLKFKARGAWSGASEYWLYHIALVMEGREDGVGDWVEEETISSYQYADGDGHLALPETEEITAERGRQKRIKEVRITAT